jgi:predicted RNA-binding Zn ribbon-like protein
MRSVAASVVLCLAACTAAPERVSARPLETAIAEGVAFLVRTQEPSGAWGAGRDTTRFDVMASVPGSHDAFRVGSTALAAMALREAGEREASGRGLAYLASYDGPKRANRLELYNVWAHTYALEALARAWKEDGRPKYRDAARRHLERLAASETYLGGWNYYDFVHGLRTPSMAPTSFGSAAGLIALHAAREAGLTVPEPLWKRALARLEEMRLPGGAFLYSADMKYHPRHPANQIKGSLGRTQAGHHALRVWDSATLGEAEILEGLETFFREHRFLEIGRKRQYPHEGWYMTAGYYYYFGHYHAAKLVEGLRDPGPWKARLAERILPFQEPDGSWWDFKMWDYHPTYGTAYALMALIRCRPAINAAASSAASSSGAAPSSGPARTPPSPRAAPPAGPPPAPPGPP